jgi:hypothetical protein
LNFYYAKNVRLEPLWPSKALFFNKTMNFKSEFWQSFLESLPSVRLGADAAQSSQAQVWPWVGSCSHGFGQGIGPKLNHGI